jgi:sugar lactone lactonase YvrE
LGEGSTIFHAAHSVRFDADDNMWLVDAGNNVVVRFNAKGRIVQALGRRLEPWVYLTHGIERRHSGPGELLSADRRLPGWFDSIHAIACPDDKTVYVANEFSYRFDKVVLE